jgi:hypothetical protein
MNWTNGSSSANTHWYTHTIPNSQRHAGAAIANANRNCDTLAGSGDACAKP